MTYAVIALGGALGSLARYLFSSFVYRLATPLFPFGTFAVNVIGCAVFGVIAGMAQQRFVLGPQARAFLLYPVSPRLRASTRASRTASCSH